MEIKATIDEIIDHGWTYEIRATINGIGRVFFEIDPTEEKLKFHIQKQWELLAKCQETWKKHQGGDGEADYRKQIGKEFTL